MFNLKSREKARYVRCCTKDLLLSEENLREKKRIFTLNSRKLYKRECEKSYKYLHNVNIDVNLPDKFEF